MEQQIALQVVELYKFHFLLTFYFVPLPYQISWHFSWRSDTAYAVIYLQLCTQRLPRDCLAASCYQTECVRANSPAFARCLKGNWILLFYSTANLKNKTKPKKPIKPHGTAVVWNLHFTGSFDHGIQKLFWGKRVETVTQTE